ncbi:MAG: hypothetical protein NTY12_00700 [Candidatus Falkowbacteria bacterium]|nr:hypothetical protein [Candidatus Falkowbacteria bacterium]
MKEKLELESDPQLFKGEIRENPKKGKIIVLAGYHYNEKFFGQFLKKAFEENIKDPGQHVDFLVLEKSDVAGGDIAPLSEKEMDEYVNKNGGWEKYEALVDIHCDKYLDSDDDDMVRVSMGPNYKQEEVKKELSAISRGQGEDIKITDKFHFQLSKKERDQVIKDNYDTFGKEIEKFDMTRDREMPVLKLDPRIANFQDEINNYLKGEPITSPELIKLVNSEIAILTKFSNLVLDNE